ncbi:MAG: LCP family protein [Lachnospiraceae bacterium]|nr:LCP family protein [Lachnospiraceae bacterium]
MADKAKKSTTRKKKLTKKQRGKRKLVLFIVEILVLLLLAGVLFVVSKLNSMNEGELDETDLEINIDEETQEMLKGYTNIALFGLDNRSSGNYDTGNSDAIMIASINNDTKEVRIVSVFRDSYLAVDDKDSLRKVNYAYAHGGPQEAVKALNKNLDLNITEYVAVDFQALAMTINKLGGIELTITDAEANNEYTRAYIDEMNEKFGAGASYLPSGENVHVDGWQATAYARLRAIGDDYGRTERQRTVITKMVEKAKQADLATLTGIINEMTDYIGTSLSASEIIGLAASMQDYELVDTQGWPFKLTTGTTSGGASVVIPTDLETNVILLHEYLFGTDGYEPSDVVSTLSQRISADTGTNADSTVRDTTPEGLVNAGTPDTEEESE